jgi:hypothetical protein
MRRWVLVAVLLAGSLTACGTTSDSALDTDAVVTSTSSTTQPDVAAADNATPSVSPNSTLASTTVRVAEPESTGEVAEASTTTEPAVTEPESTTAAGATELPPTAQPAVGPTLEEILDPYEAAAVSGHGLQSFAVDDCYRNGWGSDLADTNQLATQGDVLLCGGQSEPPTELGSLLVVVVDDAGTTASLWETVDSGERLALWSSGEQSLPFDTASGQLCREFLANPVLDGWLTDPFYVERGSTRNAYVLVLAYWFLEGQPMRMDVDGNGIPCETLFPSDVADDVWAGDF